MAEGQLDVVATGRHFIDSAALFVAFFAIAGEDDAIAGADGSPGRNDDTPAANCFYIAHQYAALGRASPGHEHLVIASAEPTRGEAARKREFHFGDVLLGKIRRT